MVKAIEVERIVRNEPYILALAEKSQEILWEVCSFFALMKKKIKTFPVSVMSAITCVMAIRICFIECYDHYMAA
jgi:hypothetical protein